MGATIAGIILALILIVFIVIGIQDSKEMREFNINELKRDLNWANKAYKKESDENKYLQQNLDTTLEDIEVCLEVIKQESKISNDKRTRKEMKLCVDTLEETVEMLKTVKHF